MQQNNLPITIAIIEDDKTIREGLNYLVNNEQGFYVSGAFQNAEDALLKLKGDSPDVI